MITYYNSPPFLSFTESQRTTLWKTETIICFFSGNQLEDTGLGRDIEGEKKIPWPKGKKMEEGKGKMRWLKGKSKDRIDLIPSE